MDARTRTAGRSAWGALALVVLLAPPASPGPSGGEAVPPPEPASAWLFDDGSGTMAADSYGVLPGTLEGGMGALNWDSGTPYAYAGNTSLVFDGLDDRVKIADGNVVAGRENMTISAWFWWSDDGSHKEFTIFGERDECGFNITHLGIERRFGIPNGLSFGIFERIPSTGCGTGGWHVTVSPTVPTPDAWHHASAVLDETGGMRLYLDGVLVDSDSSTATYVGLGGVCSIGQTHTLAYDSYWSGKLDEIAVFTQALSGEEILWLYENSIDGLPPPVSSYCTAGTSASGCQALLSATGTASATASTGFSLNAAGVEGNRPGLYFFGKIGRQANSWGNGTSLQCVKPPVKRGGLLVGTGTSGACDGSFNQDLNAHWTAFPNKNPGAGAVVQAQLWYRDPFNTSNQTTSLSDAIEFTVAP